MGKIANKISASRSNHRGAMTPNGSADNQSNRNNMGIQNVRSRGQHNAEHNHMANRQQNGQNRQQSGQNRHQSGQNIANARQQIYKCCFCSSQFVYPNSVITHCEQVSHFYDS